MGGYSASKAAAYSVTQALHPELKGKRIEILAALPGPIDTEGLGSFLADLATFAPGGICQRSAPDHEIRMHRRGNMLGVVVPIDEAGGALDLKARRRDPRFERLVPLVGKALVAEPTELGVKLPREGVRERYIVPLNSVKSLR